MTSNDLDSSLVLAFASGSTIPIRSGSGVLQRRALADIVLPTGRIGTGYPARNFVDQPNSVVPQVDPGTYPVYISTAHSGTWLSAAFLSVVFDPLLPATWQPAGSFFTDSGLGLVYDNSLAEAIRQHTAENGWGIWKNTKYEALHNGDGSVLIDSVTGANAIAFKTRDFVYPVYTGHDNSGRTLCLVVDCCRPL